MLLQATLNGNLTRSEHPRVPISAEELAADARACVEAGAGAIHLHPRDGDGREQLDGATIDSVVEHVRSACGVPVGVSTGAWIEPDLDRRLALIGTWHAPDYASVNVSEPGAEQVIWALSKAGIGVEAGVWTVEDAVRLAGFGLDDALTRIMVEPVAVAASAAVVLVGEIHDALDDFDRVTPRLQHGDGPSTWVLIRDAIERGFDTRVGLEDTLYGPTGDLVPGNPALVLAATEITALVRKVSSQGL
jgi:uncharacterized protein (DUF849 family)